MIAAEQQPPQRPVSSAPSEAAPAAGPGLVGSNPVSTRGQTVFGALMIGLLSVVVWLFAESETLVTRDFNIPVRFVVPEGNALHTELDRAWKGVATVTVRGARGVVDGFTAGTVELVLGAAGVPADPGEQQVVLRDALGQATPFARSGASVVKVAPPAVSMRVEPVLTETGVPLRLHLEDVELRGAPVFAPGSVSVTGPASAVHAFLESGKAHASASLLDATDIEPGRSRTLPARVALDWSLVDLADKLRFEPDRVDVTVSVQSQLAEHLLPSVPVWVSMPPGAAVRADIEEGSRILANVTVRGPSDLVDQIVSNELRVRALVAVTDDDLGSRIKTKDASFAHYEGRGLTFECDSFSVHLVYTPVQGATAE